MFSITFLLVVGAFHVAHGQVCSWTKVQPLPATYTRSVSSSVDIVMTATNENFPDGGRLTWEGKKGSTTVDLSILRYSQSADSFTEILSSPRGSSSSSVGNHNISLSSLKISDDGLQISAVSGGCTSEDRSPTITLEVKYCNLSHFAPNATATNASDCGNNCEKTFACQDHGSPTFTATCQEDATWSQDMAQCDFCNATTLEPTAIQVDNSIRTGVNQTKVFDCVCPTGVQSFVAKCQSDLTWNYTASTIPCRAACDASEVTFASPNNASFMCGVQPFTCNSRLSCAPNTFNLTCADDGTWVSLENKCIEDSWKEVVPYVMLGISCFSNVLLCIYLCYWYGTCLSKLHKPETSVALFAALFPVIEIALWITNLIMVLAAGFCSPATVYGGTALGCFLVFFNFTNFLVKFCSDRSKFVETQSTSRWELFKELICAPFHCS